jgi:vacuolar-type H+-ATPase subunit H
MDPYAHPTDPVGIAIQRVLEAERDAQADIARARAEADARLAAARARAAGILARADHRIAAARAAVDARLARRQREVDAAIRKLVATATRDAGDDDRVTRAAERVAAELTGEEAP